GRPPDTAGSRLGVMDQTIRAGDGGRELGVDKRFEFGPLLRRERMATSEQLLHAVVLGLGEVRIGLKPLDQHRRLRDIVAPIRRQRIQRFAHGPPYGLAITSDGPEAGFAPLAGFWMNGDGRHGVAPSLFWISGSPLRRAAEKEVDPQFRQHSAARPRSPMPTGGAPYFEG